MVSACSFVGVGIQGITVPLRSGMTVPTNNNFVDTDLNQLTGLVGDGSTKWMHTNTIDSDVLQDDASLSCWVSDIGTQRLQGFWVLLTCDLTQTIQTLLVFGCGAKALPVTFHWFYY